MELSKIVFQKLYISFKKQTKNMCKKIYFRPVLRKYLSSVLKIKDHVVEKRKLVSVRAGRWHERPIRPFLIV
jgi:hypothetical protein